METSVLPIDNALLLRVPYILWNRLCFHCLEMGWICGNKSSVKSVNFFPSLCIRFMPNVLSMGCLESCYCIHVWWNTCLMKYKCIFSQAVNTCFTVTLFCSCLDRRNMCILSVAGTQVPEGLLDGRFLQICWFYLLSIWFCSGFSPVLLLLQTRFVFDVYNSLIRTWLHNKNTLTVSTDKIKCRTCWGCRLSHFIISCKHNSSFTYMRTHLS